MLIVGMRIPINITVQKKNHVQYQKIVVNLKKHFLQEYVKMKIMIISSKY